MGFDFGNMLKSMGSNFMANAAKGSGKPGGQASPGDAMAMIGTAFGGGGGEPEFAPPQADNGLAQLLASLTQNGGSALANAAPAPRPSYRVDPAQPLFARRRFGFGGGQA
jgi:hypothetical protein